MGPRSIRRGRALKCVTEPNRVPLSGAATPRWWTLKVEAKSALGGTDTDISD